MARRYTTVLKPYGHVLSSPSELHDPESGALACRIWSWVADPDGKRAHHFDSRSDAKAIVRQLGVAMSQVSFRKVA